MFKLVEQHDFLDQRLGLVVAGMVATFVGGCAVYSSGSLLLTTQGKQQNRFVSERLFYYLKPTYRCLCLSVRHILVSHPTNYSEVREKDTLLEHPV
jgi:hypothetical protein